MEKSPHRPMLGQIEVFSKRLEAARMNSLDSV